MSQTTPEPVDAAADAAPTNGDNALESVIRDGLDRVEELLARSVSGSGPLIDELTSHLCQAGGKRMRPLLTLLCAQLGEAGQPVNQRVIDAAAAVELTHLATLYHDDVMDCAPRRRGVPAAQHQWGNNRAILAGDVLFARASRLVSKLGQESIEYHARTFERLCTGQLNETFGPAANADPVDFYLQVLADKTGSLINTAAVFGAWHGGAPAEFAQAVASYGDDVGVAFQLADDVIDLTSAGDVSGKTPGTDLLEGVVTLPILLLRQARENGEEDAAGRQILEALDGGISAGEQLSEVLAQLGSHPVVERTRKLANDYAQRAIDALGPLPDGEVKDALVEFARRVVERIN